MKIAVYEVQDQERRGSQTLQPRHAVGCLAAPMTEASTAAYADVEGVATFIRSDLRPPASRQLP